MGIALWVAIGVAMPKAGRPLCKSSDRNVAFKSCPSIASR